MTITAKIVTDSISPQGIRLTTMQLRYPKFIHGEFMTHRVFSRNASSSRAIPVERLIKDVIEDPVYPSFWGKNQSGMQAKEEHDDPVFQDRLAREKSDTRYLWSRTQAWDAARKRAIAAAYAFADAGYHKQVVNRLLEPFCHINVVVSSTEWSNFFALRCHPDAQPEMRMLAEEMRKAQEASKPDHLSHDMWHVPYITDRDWALLDSYLNMEKLVRISVARCARVSYLTQEGKAPDADEDLKLYERLVGSVPLHASPAEHQAYPDTTYTPKRHINNMEWEHPELHGNLRGWIQYRKTLPGENQ